MKFKVGDKVTANGEYDDKYTDGRFIRGCIESGVDFIFKGPSSYNMTISMNLNHPNVHIFLKSWNFKRMDYNLDEHTINKCFKLAGPRKKLLVKDLLDE